MNAHAGRGLELAFRRAVAPRYIRTMSLVPSPLLSLLTLMVQAQPPGPAPAAVQFMGIGADVTRVAFVCDGSRWVETKDEELFAELLRAVEPLGPDRHFSVIFAADGKVTGPEGGRPIAATAENKRKLRNWLESFAPNGRDSTPAVGLELAFEGKPDAVFFVSDGQFERYDDVRRLVASVNPQRAARVHAVGYFRNEREDDSRQFIEFMQKLAKANGGEFKLAYADEMRRQVD